MPIAGLGIFLVGVTPSIVMVTIALAMVFFTLPFIEGCTSAIVQSKVDQKVQGRVFAITHMIAGFMAPVAYVAAGPLADKVFEPLMAPGTAFAEKLGPLIGTGQGRGIGLLLMVVGIILLLTTLVGFCIPRLRKVEDELPDMVPDEPTQPLSAPVPAPSP